MDYQEILKANDSQDFWEWPPEFDRNAEEAAFLQFANDLETVLGQHLEIESGVLIQDASFHSQIDIVHLEDVRTQIRFSNFGRMVTVYGLNESEQVQGDLLGTIVRLTSEHGYVYIPASELHMPYTNSAGLELGIRDWYFRFFEYL